jgi:hypothetical protein
MASAPINGIGQKNWKEIPLWNVGLCFLCQMQPTAEAEAATSRTFTLLLPIGTLFRKLPDHSAQPCNVIKYHLVQHLKMPRDTLTVLNIEQPAPESRGSVADS